MDKVTTLGERLKITGTEVGRKMTAGMTSMSFKMNKFFQGPNLADAIIDEATSDVINEPDWPTIFEICDMINHERINSVEVIRGIKKRIMSKTARVQYLALVLLEIVVNNCEKACSEVAAEQVLDDMVKLIDDPQTGGVNRDKALMLIEAWGESSNELRYLPVYEETYKNLRSRGIRFPECKSESMVPTFSPLRSVSEAVIDATVTQRDIPAQSFSTVQTREAFDVARNSLKLLSAVLSSSPQQEVLEDDLTKILVQQCHQSQYTVQKIIETTGDNEALLFEALNVNDEIQKVLSKYEDLKKPSVAASSALEPALIPVAIELAASPLATKEDALITKPFGSGGGFP